MINTKFAELVNIDNDLEESVQKAKKLYSRRNNFCPSDRHNLWFCS